ncbi:hypothetical protein TNIN_1731 [Trichonephila inaurata madagascariensis]|uniref:Uncharacterized protein n=1 Tax=Trichonephila inaurata madagascariensis TaxID=2747483 RepID=A0A8X6YNU2_9ARAC|nr:hypothetical protein TNIN_1731 [Trichonephila inaurata madagascariensis]
MRAKGDVLLHATNLIMQAETGILKPGVLNAVRSHQTREYAMQRVGFRYYCMGIVGHMANYAKCLKKSFTGQKDLQPTTSR